MKSITSLQKGKFSLSIPSRTALLVEAGLVVLSTAAITYIIYINSGGPLGSDSLGYLNAALNNLKQTGIVNRYTFIFLLKFFMMLSNTPLAGARVGTSLILGAGILLVYLAARLFSHRSSPLQGVLAVALFLSTPVINGDTIQVDATAMVIGLAFVVVYLASSRLAHRQPWLLALTGFLLYVAYRAKETTLPLSVILLGLGFVEGHFALRRMAIRLAWVAAGVLAGLLVFITLNIAILGDPWFGIRPADMIGPYNFYKATGPVGASPQDWFTTYIVSNLPVIFILYLLAAVRSRQWQADQWLVWLAPLLMVEFLDLTTSWGTFSRYLFPTLPVVCLLAAQALEFDPAPIQKPWAWVGTGLLLVALLEGLPWVLINQKWFTFTTIQSIDQQVALPISLAILLVFLAYFRPLTLRTVWIPVACLGMILAIPLQKNYQAISGELSPRVLTAMRLYPITTFKGKIHVAPQVKILVSNNMTDALWIMENRDELMSIFNIATRSNLEKTNFEFIDAPDQLGNDIQRFHANYVLMARAYWKAAAGQDAARQQIEALCQITWSDDQKFLLLTCSP